MEALEQVPARLDRWLQPLVRLLVRIFPNVHPNWYTSLRIVLIPPTIVLLPEHWYGALFLFLLGVVLDLIDGPVARYTKRTSRSGAFLDPFADKLLFLSVLVFFRPDVQSVLFWALFTVETVLLLEHTFKFFYFRHADQQVRKQKQASNVWGKIKFGCEVAAIIALFLTPITALFFTLATIIMVIACGLAMKSLWSHLRSYTN